MKLSLTISVSIRENVADLNRAFSCKQTHLTSNSMQIIFLFLRVKCIQELGIIAKIE